MVALVVFIFIDYTVSTEPCLHITQSRLKRDKGAISHYHIEEMAQPLLCRTLCPKLLVHSLTAREVIRARLVYRRHYWRVQQEVSLLTLNQTNIARRVSMCT